MMSKVVSVLLLAILIGTMGSFASSSAMNSTKKHKDRLLLISFDGFRWDYLQRTDTPNFDRITKNGVQAVHGLLNAFITKTFPNHFTLVTGMWEETHGIIANYMYDPILNQSFAPHDVQANKDAAWFDQGGEPIWVTNQLQRKDGKSGVIMWVGGDAPIKGVHPTKFMEFDADVKNETKVDTMIEWFKEDFDLGLIYFPQPDEYGHLFGPESVEVTNMIGGLDQLIGYLFDKLNKEGMLEDTNIIITSDHGFTSTPLDKYIDANEIVDPTTYKLGSQSPVAGVWPLKGFHDAIYKNLSQAAQNGGHFTVYLKEDIPKHFHYSDNRRIPPIVVVADDHYSFSQGPPLWDQKGNHGYDNRLQDMHPFFVAMGPAFKSGFTVDTFESVDIYPLMCHILGLEPAPNNGSMDIVGTLLLQERNVRKALSFLEKHYVATIVVSCVIFSALMMLIAIAVNGNIKKHKEGRNTVVTMDKVTVTVEEADTVRPLSDNSDVPLLSQLDY